MELSWEQLASALSPSASRPLSSSALQQAVEDGSLGILIPQPFSGSTSQAQLVVAYHLTFSTWLGSDNVWVTSMGSNASPQSLPAIADALVKESKKRGWGRVEWGLKSQEAEVMRPEIFSDPYKGNLYIPKSKTQVPTIRPKPVITSVDNPSEFSSLKNLFSSLHR